MDNDKRADIANTVECRGRYLERRECGARPGGYGLCSNCRSFKYIATSLMDEEVWCGCEGNERRKLRPNKFDPIVKCAYHYPAGQQDLYIMTMMATLINVDKKNPIGFGSPEAVVTIDEPDPEYKTNG